MLDEKVQNSKIPSHEKVNLEQLQGPVKENRLSRPEVTGVLDEMVKIGEMASKIVQGSSSNSQEKVTLDQVQDTGKKVHHIITESGYQNSSPEIEDEYRVIHSEDDIDDSKLEHMGPIDEDLLDVFDPGDREDFAMDVNQITKNQGLSPRGHLLKSEKGIKQTLPSMPGHTARPFTRSHSHKIAR